MRARMGEESHRNLLALGTVAREGKERVEEDKAREKRGLRKQESAASSLSDCARGLLPERRWRVWRLLPQVLQ